MDPVVGDPGDGGDRGRESQLPRNRGARRAASIRWYSTLALRRLKRLEDLAASASLISPGFDQLGSMARNSPALTTAQASAEVFSLIAQMAEDLDGRPLVVRRSGAGGDRIEITRERVEHVGPALERAAGGGEGVNRIGQSNRQCTRV
jgi:hypothetical protein